MPKVYQEHGGEVAIYLLCEEAADNFIVNTVIKTDTPVSFHRIPICGNMWWKQTEDGGFRCTYDSTKRCDRAFPHNEINGSAAYYANYLAWQKDLVATALQDPELRKEAQQNFWRYQRDDGESRLVELKRQVAQMEAKIVRAQGELDSL